ncbi:MAG: ABC transporter permease [Gammaproteobacteria bacterium]|nr:MAG: ABC transporter permease [Gammaproteobacteria bacterium]
MRVLIFALIVILIVSMTMAVSIGSISLPFGRVWSIIFDQMFPNILNGDWPRNEIGIVWQIRLPRVILGALVGAGLAVAGTTIQSLVRNPLADPYLLGISSGACTGAVFVLLFASRLFEISLEGLYAVSFAAFLGAFFAFFLVFAIAQEANKLTPTRMILAGLAVSYLFMALTNFMIYLEQRNGATSAMFWMLGGLGGARWDKLTVPTIVLTGSIIFLYLQARSLNSMLMGDENATTLGVDINRFRRILFVATSVLTGALVAVSGSIGFVGLIIPHVTRMLVGADHRRVLPVAALIGAIFLIWVDVFARVVFAPRELPLGIVTGFIGAPFFVWLLKTKGKLS